MRVLILLSVILFTACDKQDGPEIKGSTNIISEIRTIEPFEKIHISSVINATITNGSQAITIQANDNILELVKTEVKDNTLFINLEDGNYNDIDVTASISIETLSELTTNEVSSAIVSDFNNLDQLVLNIEGVGNVQMSGSANMVHVFSSGSSNLEAFNLTSANYKVDLTGVGNVQITATEELSGALSGVGNILYKGSPSIDIEVTGVGNVVNAN